MAEITAAQVKELRERTGAGMMDCKKALAETGGDFERAVDWLRAKGLAAAAKKASRTAAEGLVGVRVEGSRGAMVEVNAETDFVSRNDRFQAFVSAVASVALAVGEDVSAILDSPMPGGAGTVRDALTANIATIGEQQAVRRAAVVAVDPGVVASYVHNAAAPDMGKIGVLVALESRAEPEALQALGRQLAMHVAAANPLAVSPEEIAPEVLARERAIAEEKAAASGKPADIAARMVEGAVRKFAGDQALLTQVFVLDGKTKVADAVAAEARRLGHEIRIARFVRFQLGEGIERPQSDFAAEVAAAAGHA